VDDSPSAQQRLAQREQAHAVEQAIGRLPPKQRTAVVLRYYEGLSGRETAAAMGTSLKAVQRLLARARAALEARLGEFFRE
jgi:RNA polymerase sigma-70 factor (ECF subfamily)